MSKVLLEKLPYSTPKMEVLAFAMDRATCIAPGSPATVNRNGNYGDYLGLEEI